MERLIEHRAAPRRAFRLDAVADYFPRHSSGRWWENFEVRTADIGEGGFQVVTTVPMQVGARLRLVVESGIAPAEPGPSIEGTIVWVNAPAIPWLGTYRAGIAFHPSRPAVLQPILESVEGPSAVAATA